jgi:tRNA uridine 5-carbamoylmethylation protein Kti12
LRTGRSTLSGSPSSGKTTLLAKAAEVLYQKVQRSNESDGSLVFPLNMRLRHHYFDDPQQFSTATTTILFDAIRPHLFAAQLDSVNQYSSCDVAKCQIIV